MGLVNYVAQYLPHIATVAAPITSLTRNADFEWTQLHDKSFKHVKDIAAQHFVLTPTNYDSQETIFVVPDASMIGSGSWLGQGKHIEHTKPACFDSRKFSLAQTNYSTHGKELLAIIDTLQAFEHDLIGTQCTVVTDHQSLQFWNWQKHLSNQNRRWLQFLSHFDFKIVY